MTQDWKDKGTGDWDKLFNFMDSNDFSVADFLACICAKLLRDSPMQSSYDTEIMLQGVKFKIKIEPEVWSPKTDK